jgi:hypothetical protein
VTLGYIGSPQDDGNGDIATTAEAAAAIRLVLGGRPVAGNLVDCEARHGMDR